MNKVTYTMTERFYKTLCYELRTKNKGKILDYLNKSLGLKDKIGDIKIIKKIK